jgi:hypothetical protein
MGGSSFSTAGLLNVVEKQNLIIIYTYLHPPLGQLMKSVGSHGSFINSIHDEGEGFVCTELSS